MWLPDTFGVPLLETMEQAEKFYSNPHAARYDSENLDPWFIVITHIIWLIWGQNLVNIVRNISPSANSWWKAIMYGLLYIFIYPFAELKLSVSQSSTDRPWTLSLQDNAISTFDTYEYFLLARCWKYLWCHDIPTVRKPGTSLSAGLHLWLIIPGYYLLSYSDLFYFRWSNITLKRYEFSISIVSYFQPSKTKFVLSLMIL